MVDDAKDALGTLGRNGVVERRRKVFQDERDAEHQRTRERRRMRAVDGGLHDHDDEGGDSEGRTDSMRHGVDDLFAQGVLGDRMLAHRVGGAPRR